MPHTRRTFLAAAGATITGAPVSKWSFGAQQPSKKHIVTLSFDDGFKKSSIKTAEIYEKYKLSACINVVASAHMTGFRPPDYPEVHRAAFGLWNDLAARGHEIMPHGYLERLLERLVAIETVEVLPAGRALAKCVS